MAKDKEIEAALWQFMAAWDNLPIGKHGVAAIQRWITDELTPAAKAARAALAGDRS